MVRCELKILILISFFVKISKCTITGISYMDPMNPRSLPDNNRQDVCNPLYWYPRPIPPYCYQNTPKPNVVQPPNGPVPLPIPVPMHPPPPMPFPHPQPAPFPFPMPAPLPFPQPVPQPVPQQVPQPLPQPVPQPIPQPVPQPIPQPVPMPPLMPAAPAPLPLGFPLLPSSPMVPVPGMPYPSPYPYRPPSQFGMVPGIRGLVSPGGGINILPFSDAYSNMLETHKNRLMRRRFRKMFPRYNRNRNSRRGGRKYRRRLSRFY